MAQQDEAKPCQKCKAEEASLRLRAAPTCKNCYTKYVDEKVGRRVAAMGKETRPTFLPDPRRYLGGLSFGPSSSAMTKILNQIVLHHSTNKSSSPMACTLVHVDVDLAHRGSLPTVETQTPAMRLLAKYRERFPHLSLECVHLSKVLEVKTVDWTTLPSMEGETPMEKLRNLIDQLPSASSRADMLRLLTRHLLLHLAIEGGYTALVLGHSTTALASLTLSEVANGRGFSVPWQINDGLFTVSTYSGRSSVESMSGDITRTEYPVYYPMREVMKYEITTYIDIDTSVGLKDLVPADQLSPTTSVVSHKDTSIEEVMTRYFDGIDEANYGIVANVVRTSGKLEKPADEESCRLCGMKLDERGDSTWAGELGDEVQDGATGTKLCYGCKRSLKG